MNLYALVEYNRVVQLKESEVMPEAPASPTSIWVDVTGSTDMRVGWGATFNGIWTFSAPTDEELRNEAEQQKWQLLNVAAHWLLMNSLQFKVDLAVASAEEQARLLAHKQYCIALSDVDKQSGYPTNIMWPVAPY
ncbi:tail fiber assembly protein [Pseudomonas sp. SWRI111]|uniref:tail fiber assembly protein n=1 Tax=Pseudomonas sp. SWRI111 TaxID=2745507 RepID=UPI00164496CE|nr:tail fiber assembly protein [Pseudomonas sp. SWRI111]MBC3208834.1 tail fiber assembly protein [Pseudomonas sp. SWRI111]